MATKRENKLIIQVSGVSKMEFRTKEVSISDGQPFDRDVESKMGDDGISWELVFKAGRHGTSDVAEKFIDYITDNKTTTGASIATDSYDNHPSKLNFAFLGDLVIKTIGDDKEYIGKDIVFAQGHNGRSRNNWWIGGRNMNNIIDVSIIKGIEQKFVKNEKNIDAFFCQLVGFIPASSVNKFKVTIISI